MKKILTGVRPTGSLHIGHYLAFIPELLELQKKYKVFLMIADLHSQTYPFPYQPRNLEENVYNLAAEFIALGVDPKKVLIFRQSAVPAHLSLYWILGCLASVGDLERMTQYKEMRERFKDRFTSAGLLMYPVLMAADILIYQPDLIPIGKDQSQHLEMARTLAQRFNHYFGQTFRIPSTYAPKENGQIKSLDEPLKKMAKSKPAGALFIFESEKKIEEKIKRAVTDSGSEILYEPEKKPAISNLMIIYKALTQKTFAEIEDEFRNRGYGDFKKALTREFLGFFKKARQRKESLNKVKINKILKTSAKIANKEAVKTLKLVFERTGLS